MLPLKRLHHLLGHHYPGVKLCAAVHPWVIQCAVVAFSVSFFMLHFWEEVIVSGGENPSVYLPPPPFFLCFFRHYCTSTLLCPPHPPTLPPYRRLLEEFFYSDLVSVNEEEPPTFHTLIFTFHARVDNSLVEYLF